ncbi:Helix-loop-helix DNA-binding protein [Ophiocordyceps camponoti-floridani]|uniref:Helix-loop-helix DNA-binding protein n=1 Tax=Ophiocordyceps camponoti-floridani TaxID=2030778 RepID=A0A8H4QAT7_9HYPO|nr:Helix-loop-helix DNA-binding protein [Ophiocordyceps camponoti-floridani]
MSSYNNQHHHVTASGDGAAPAILEEKPRLTEEEKKQNHIASEQKRRQAIREGFDRLTELVPGLEGQARSEGLVLKRTVAFMRHQLQERMRLIDAVEKAGGYVDEQLKKVPKRSPNGSSTG